MHRESPSPVDIDPGALRHTQLDGERSTLGPCGGNSNIPGSGVVEANTTEIDWQLVFQAPHQGLENALHVLAFADRVGDLLDQVQPLKLRLQLSRGLFALGVDAVQKRGAGPDEAAKYEHIRERNERYSRLGPIPSRALALEAQPSGQNRDQ